MPPLYSCERAEDLKCTWPRYTSVKPQAYKGSLSLNTKLQSEPHLINTYYHNFAILQCLNFNLELCMFVIFFYWDIDPWWKWRILMQLNSGCIKSPENQGIWWWNWNMAEKKLKDEKMKDWGGIVQDYNVDRASSRAGASEEATLHQVSTFTATSIHILANNPKPLSQFWTLIMIQSPLLKKFLKKDY